MSYVLRSIRIEPERIWTSAELYEIYLSKGAIDTSRVRILKASRLAAISIHKEKAASIFKVTSVIDDPDEEMIKKKEKMIKADIARKKHNVSAYSSLKRERLNQNSNDTLSCFPRSLHS